MTHSELEAEICRVFGCKGPKFGSSLDGYDAPGGGNIYIPVDLTSDQRKELLEAHRKKFGL
jgi:hypothetical protein